MRVPAHLDQWNLGAVRNRPEGLDLSAPADLRKIETALSKIEVHGGRMNEERMNAVDQTE